MSKGWMYPKEEKRKGMPPPTFSSIEMVVFSLSATLRQCYLAAIVQFYPSLLIYLIRRSWKLKTRYMCQIFDALEKRTRSSFFMLIALDESEKRKWTTFFMYAKWGTCPFLWLLAVANEHKQLLLLGHRKRSSGYPGWGCGGLGPLLGHREHSSRYPG